MNASIQEERQLDAIADKIVALTLNQCDVYATSVPEIFGDRFKSNQYDFRKSKEIFLRNRVIEKLSKLGDISNDTQ